MPEEGTAENAATGDVSRLNSLSMQEVATLLGVSVDSVRRRIRSGALPAFTLGSRLVRIRVADVEALMASGAL